MTVLQLSHQHKVLLWDCYAALTASQSLASLIALNHHSQPIPKDVRKVLFDLAKKCRERSAELRLVLESAGALCEEAL